MTISRPAVRVAVAAGLVGLMAAGAHLDVPMAPVPMSMQSVAVLLAGAVLGLRWGVAAVLAYLLLGGLGAPVFADGSAGWDSFSGATGGYLIAFPVAAALTGGAVERGWLDRWAPALGLFAAGHGVLLLVGAAWLATSVGLADAWRGGAQPFLIGALVKSALLTVLVVPWRRGRHRVA